MKLTMFRKPVIGVAIILVAMFALEILSSVQESQTWDEAVHLSAGFSYWRTGDFRLNPEHPPLLKLLAAAPLLFTNATLPLNDPSWLKIDEWRFGELFLYENTLSPQTLLLLGRLPMMILSVLLGLLIFKVSRRMFGTVGAFVSLSLYAFDPSIIAHSRFITTDLGFTLFAFLTLVRLNALFERPTKKNSFFFGLSLLAMGLAKFSGSALLIVLIVIVALLKMHTPKHPSVAWKNVQRWLIIFLPLAWLVIWSVYAFDVRSPGTDPRVARLEIEKTEVLKTTPPAVMTAIQRFAVTTLGDQTHGLGAWLERMKHHAYPTYTFFRGLTAVISHATGGHGSFLLGMYGDQGWWYYFPVALIAKTPLPTLVAFMGMLLFIFASIKRTHRRTTSCLAMYRSLDRRWIIFLAMPVGFLAIAMVGHLNLGWRHIMPIYPPLYVLTGFVGALKIPGAAWRRLIIPLLLIVNILVVEFSAWPNQMGFFSQLVGGSHNGPNILQDSNLDWGQDLPKLATFIRQSRITQLPFAYYGQARISVYVPQAVHLPTSDEVAAAGPPQGLVAISIGSLYDKSGAYRWLWSHVPVRKVGSGILIYSL